MVSQPSLAKGFQDPTRKIPSECLPTNVVDQAEYDNSQSLIGLLYGLTHIRPDANFTGPNDAALKRFLGSYVGTAFERQIWDRYLDYSRVPRDDWPKVEAAAESAELSEWEYIAQKTLDELKRYAKANGIPERLEPTQQGEVAAADPSSPAKDKLETPPDLEEHDVDNHLQEPPANTAAPAKWPILKARMVALLEVLDSRNGIAIEHQEELLAYDELKLYYSDRKTLGKDLTYLRECDYVAPPPGRKKKGVIITPEGSDRLKHTCGVPLDGATSARKAP